MVTTGAAAIAGLADKLGSLEIGRPADVLVLARCAEPYESVCAATPTTSNWCSSAAAWPTDEPTGCTPWRKTPPTPTSNPSLPGADPCCSTPATRANPTTIPPLDSRNYEPTSPVTIPRSAPSGPKPASLLDQDDLTIQVLGHSCTGANPDPMLSRPGGPRAVSRPAASCEPCTGGPRAYSVPSLSTRVGVRPP
jgi:hypothetical protein